MWWLLPASSMLLLLQFCAIVVIEPVRVVIAAAVIVEGEGAGVVDDVVQSNGFKVTRKEESHVMQPSTTNQH